MSAASPSFTQAAERALEFAERQLDRLVRAERDHFPLYTVDGRWRHDGAMWTDWGAGFLCGLLWILARRTGEARWRERAERCSRLIEPRKHDRDVHDLGFLFWPSWKRWYDLTGDPAVNEVVVQAGETLALRFNERGRYLCSFAAANSTFIDIMMNVGIIFYAAQDRGDEHLLRVAHDHCRTTWRNLVRGDGSTAHEGLFDLETGAFLRQATHQGWRDDSCWARGQSWALYGFGTVYRLTGEPACLDTAQRCADFYLDRTPAYGVPPNDWDEPAPARPYESSAAAVAAGGLWQLAELTPDQARAVRYRDATRAILLTLCSPEFLADETPGWEGILKHATYHERRGLGVDESVIWGDYFFVEALDTVLQAGPGRLLDPVGSARMHHDAGG